MDQQCDAAPARLGLGGDHRPAACPAGAGRTHALLPSAAMGGKRRPPATPRHADRRGRSAGALGGAHRLRCRGPGRPARVRRCCSGRLCAPPAQGSAQHAAGRGGHGHRQDARLSRAGLAVGGEGRRRGVGVDLHQGAAAAARCRRVAAGARRGRTPPPHRRPQGPRELPLSAQSGGCAAGRLLRPGGGARAAGRALGGLYQGRRHGWRRPAGLAA